MNSDEGLCGKCYRSSIFRGDAPSKVVIVCNSGDVPMKIPFLVSKCSDFKPQQWSPSLSYMNDIALIIKGKGSVEKPGFHLE